MEPTCRKDKEKPKPKETPNRGERAKHKSAQHELKQRQRAEVRPPCLPPSLPVLRGAALPV
ncbi:hypothetical protein Z043_125054 [Scleropages formosus]|uniref:Uncharacterized protein n=1 Tax=Scleropages formosus TaxID=113540 RepID=A0A0P7UE84_SCLFO|nr:hypothetical protein Z043_125054 [Scleropages formosus]